MIHVEHLGKRYVRHGKAPLVRFAEDLARRAFRRRGAVADGYFWALRDVSFDVEQGEVMGIIGRNGAGKSTLLKLLARVTDPTEGQAKLFGRVGSLLEVGSGFHPDLTGRENVYLNGAILGMGRTEIRKKFDEIVNFAEIEGFIDTCVKHYSSGMYMRLAFAVAAHLDTEILFCDEVLAVGDAAFQKKCLGKMDEVTGSGRTVLFVSHSADAVASLCDRVVWLNAGRVRGIGPAKEMMREYTEDCFGHSVTTADFAEDRTMPMQLLRAVMVESEHGSPGDMDVEFEYVVRERADDVMLCIEVFNSVHQSVFYANDRQRGSEFDRRPGRHRCWLTIPFSLLAPDVYQVAFGLWQPGRLAVHFPDVRLTHHRRPDSDRPDVACLAAHGVAWPSLLYAPAQWRGGEPIGPDQTAESARKSA